MTNSLEQLRSMTTIVADTGDIDSIREYTPTDATTNPSLLLKAAQQTQYQSLVRAAIEDAKRDTSSHEHHTQLALSHLAVNFGTEILSIVPGRVSTELDARLSFDIEGSIRHANELMELYSKAGVDHERILIKVPSTWEGIRCAEKLEKQDIHCNLTLLFSLAQAAACADAGVTLISPFVGRILDWYKANTDQQSYTLDTDPGVLSVRAIYHYYKKHGYQTSVMGASFRNTGEILGLAGCDLLTIAPALMDELEQSSATVERKLSPEAAASEGGDKLDLNETRFRWMLNEDAMATEKLAEGIRKFTADTLKLETYMSQQCKDCT